MKPVLVLVTLVVFGAPGASLHGQAPAPVTGAGSHHADAGKPQPGTDVPAALVGRWRSAAFELDLISNLHRSVYGPNAKSVRVAEMAISPSGEGTFSVTDLVRDRRGQTVAGTRSVQELTFVVGARDTAPGDRTRYATRVVRAERRYLDAPAGTFPLEDARLELYLPSEAKGPIEIRYDTPEGTGSFWETLRPAATHSTGRAAPAAPAQAKPRPTAASAR